MFTKHISITFIAIFLFSISASALSPSLETECCIFLGHEEDVSYGDSLLAQCPEFNLTEEKCEYILEGWKLTQDDFGRSTRPEEGNHLCQPIRSPTRTHHQFFLGLTA